MALFPFVVAVLYVGIDVTFPRLFLDTIGHAFHNREAMIQLSSLGGAHLLTFLVVLFSEAALEAWLHLQRRHRLPLRTTPAFFIVIAGWVLGEFLLHDIREEMTRPKTTVHAGLIQGNVGDFVKIMAEQGQGDADSVVINRYLKLSESALRSTPKPDFVVWPETAYPRLFGNPWNSRHIQELEGLMRAFVNTNQTPLVFGGYDSENRKDYNSVFVLSPQRNLQVYHKSVLLPFGEYIPFTEQWASTIKSIFPAMGFFGRGKGAEVLEIPLAGRSPVAVSPVICYEALVSEYSRDAVRLGSEIILNVTNDSWFGTYAEPELHFALVKFRSVETRRSQIRTTNTGITAAILPDGHVPSRTALGEETAHAVSVPVLSRGGDSTLFLRWGDWVGVLCQWLSALGLGLVAVVRVVRPSRA
jgi:apolipoprotein N-acyltransferase